MAYSSKTAGFLLKTKEIVDKRLVLSKSEMLNKKFADGTSFSKFLPAVTSEPAYLFTLCSDDLSWYYYHANNTSSAETGQFKKIPGSDGASSAKSGTAEEMAAALATAKAGDKFFNSTDGKTYVAAIDSEGNLHWVEDTPTKGTIVFDETSGKLKYYDGTQWKEVGGGGGIEDVSTLPTNPSPSVIYRLSSDKSLNTADTSGAWRKIATTNDAGALPVTTDIASLPATPTEGAIYALSNGTGETFKIYKNGQWYDLGLSWEGTQAQYDAIVNKNPSVTYYITD